MTIDQPVTTYSDATAQGRVISDYIFNIDPMDTPVVAHFGLDSANSKFKLRATAGKGEVKVELLEDTFQPLATTLANSTTLTTGTLSFTVTDGSLLQDGMVILVGSEYMVISGVSGDVVTVDSRSYGGTNATHAATSAVTIVGMARKEGDDADYVGLTSLSNPYNYTSIFQKGIEVTGSEDAIGQYGKSSEYQYQMQKAIPELTRWIERAFFHEKRRQGSASVARSMGGIETFVTSNSATATTTITKAKLEDVAAAIFSDGGVPDVLILPPGAAGTLYNLMDNSSFVRITQENTVFGMRPIARVNTQFFTNLELLVSRHCPANKVYMLDSSKVGFYTFRPFQERPLARTGDSVKGEVVGEFSLLAANGGLGHGYLTNSSGSL